MKGYKPVILLEEAGVDYDLTFADFAKTEQKAPNYMKLNPNGRIPTILDRADGDCAVFESGAVLWFLAEKDGRFLPADAKARSETMQWLMFQMGGIGPMMGQAMYLQRNAAPNGHDEPFSIKRYVDETRRLLEVLDTRLAGRDWRAGGEYTIADMATYPWARLSLGKGLDRRARPSRGLVRAPRCAPGVPEGADDPESATGLLGRCGCLGLPGRERGPFHLGCQEGLSGPSTPPRLAEERSAR